MKKFFKFMLLVGMCYALAMLLGAAFTQKSEISLIIACLWSGIILILFPVFRKAEDINE